MKLVQKLGAVILFCLAACGRTGVGPLSSNVRETKRTASKGAEWVVLYYGLADNNLAEDIRNDIQEMENYGSTEDIVFVGQADFDNNLVGETDRRFVVKPRSGQKIHTGVKKFGFDTPVKEFAELDSGNPEVLKEFVDWATKNFPAKNYALILSGHGYGFSARVRGENQPVTPVEADKGARLAQMSAQTSRGRPAFRYFSFDESPRVGVEGKSVLTTTELVAVLSSSRKENGLPKIDVVVADSCVSQTIENAYALKGLTNVFVGSQESERASGYDYQKTLMDLNDAVGAIHPLTRQVKPLDAEFFATTILDSYAALNANNTQVSAIRVNKLDPLVDGIKTMAVELLQRPEAVESWLNVQSHYFGGILAPKMWVDIRKLAADLEMSKAISCETANKIYLSLNGEGRSCVNGSPISAPEGEKAVISSQTRGRGRVGMASGLSMTFPGIGKAQSEKERTSVDWEIQVELGILESAVTQGPVGELLNKIHCKPGRPCDFYGKKYVYGEALPF